MPGFLHTVRFIAILPLLAAPAAGATIFVSNEKDNTVTVIDSVTLKVTKVIQTGARPRGMILTPDFKELIVCAGDDNRLDIVDTRNAGDRPQPRFRTRPRTARRRQQGRAHLRRQRRRRHGNRAGEVRWQGAGRDHRRRRARGNGRQQGRSHHGRHVRGHQHGAHHRQRHPEGGGQHPGGFAPARRRVHARRQDRLGVVGDRRHRGRHRSAPPTRS